MFNIAKLTTTTFLNPLCGFQKNHKKLTYFNKYEIKKLAKPTTAPPPFFLLHGICVIIVYFKQNTKKLMKILVSAFFNMAAIYMNL